MNKKKILTGSFFFTLAQFSIKIISVLYLIPFNKLTGKYGMALFNYGYIPFTIFLSLTTAGIPTGISRLVSHYKAAGDISSAYKIYRYGKWLLLFFGIIGFIVLYFVADVVSPILVPKQDASIISPQIVATIIKVSAIAIIFVPSLSIQTGFLQANHDIKSVAKSQILEHAFRLIFILGFVFLMTNTFISYFSSYQEAVNFGIYGAMFAATLAAIIALVITTKSVSKFKKGEYNHVLKDPITKAQRKKIRNEIIKLCLPTIIISLDITLYIQIDQMTFTKTMEAAGIASGTMATLGMIGNAHKVAMIITAITSSFNYPIAPAISEAHTLGSYNNLRHTTTMVKSWVMFVATPIVVFIALWSQDIYNIFDTISAQGSFILSITAIYIYIWCLYSILDNIMIGISKPMVSVWAILAGIALKSILQFPFILYLHEYGMLLATILGFTLTYIMLIFATKKHLSMSFTTSTSMQLQVIGLTLLILMPLKLISLFIPYTITSKLMSFIWSGIWFTIFISIYIGVQNKYKIIKYLFDYEGSIPEFIKRKILRR